MKLCRQCIQGPYEVSVPIDTDSEMGKCVGCGNNRPCFDIPSKHVTKRPLSEDDEDDKVEVTRTHREPDQGAPQPVQKTLPGMAPVEFLNSLNLEQLETEIQQRQAELRALRVLRRSLKEKTPRRKRTNERRTD